MFIKKAREICQNLCMHYLPLLQLIATMAVRKGQIEILENQGQEAFLQSNKELFNGKCIGYTEKRKSKLHGREEEIKAMLINKIAKTLIAKKLGVSRSRLYYFIKSRQLETT